MMPYIRGPEMKALWQQFHASDCYRRLTPAQRDVFALFDAVGRRDADKMAAQAEKLLTASAHPVEQQRFLLTAGMLGYLAQNKPAQALTLWNKHSAQALNAKPPNMVLRLILAHSVSRNAAP
jgi:hypothetical protein